MSVFKGTYGTMYYVKDMKKTVAYYKDCFGATPTYESPEWTEFNLNGHRLCLHISDPNRDLFKDGGGLLITEVSDIRKTVKDLKTKGVEFFGEVKEVHPGAYSADFKDPEGNQVSLFEDTNS